MSEWFILLSSYWTVFQSETLQSLNKTETQLVSMPSIIPFQKVVRQKASAFLFSLSKGGWCVTVLVASEARDDHRCCINPASESKRSWHRSHWSSGWIIMDSGQSPEGSWRSSRWCWDVVTSLQLSCLFVRRSSNHLHKGVSRPNFSFFGTGITVAVLKHNGTTPWFRKVLKMLLKTWVSWHLTKESCHGLLPFKHCLFWGSFRYQLNQDWAS